MVNLRNSPTQRSSHACSVWIPRSRTSAATRGEPMPTARTPHRQRNRSNSLLCQLRRAIRRSRNPIQTHRPRRSQLHRRNSRQRSRISQSPRFRFRSSPSPVRAKNPCRAKFHIHSARSRSRRNFTLGCAADSGGCFERSVHCAKNSRAAMRADWCSASLPDIRRFLRDIIRDRKAQHILLDAPLTIAVLANHAAASTESVLVIPQQFIKPR